jgi:hypothetical protein
MTEDDARPLLAMVRDHISWHERLLAALVGAVVAIAGGTMAAELIG